jgi:hypothetical protein
MSGWCLFETRERRTEKRTSGKSFYGSSVVRAFCSRDVATLDSDLYPTHRHIIAKSANIVSLWIYERDIFADPVMDHRGFAAAMSLPTTPPVQSKGYRVTAQTLVADADPTQHNRCICFLL